MHILYIHYSYPRPENRAQQKSHTMTKPSSQPEHKVASCSNISRHVCLLVTVDEPAIVVTLHFTIHT